MSERPRRTGTLALPRQHLMRQGLGELLAGNQAFRIFLWTIMSEARIFYPTHSHRSPHDTAYYEGRRSMGLEILHMLKHVRPDVLALLEREGNLMAEELRAAKPQRSDDAIQPDDDDGDADLESAQ